MHVGEDLAGDEADGFERAFTAWIAQHDVRAHRQVGETVAHRGDDTGGGLGAVRGGGEGRWAHLDPIGVVLGDRVGDHGAGGISDDEQRSREDGPLQRRGGGGPVCPIVVDLGHGGGVETPDRLEVMVGGGADLHPSEPTPPGLRRVLPGRLGGRYAPDVADTPTAAPDASARRAWLFGSPDDGMPPWVPALLRRIVFLVIAVYVAWTLARALRGFLTLLLISFFLAVALEPGVAYLTKRGWRRGSATGVIFVAAGLMLAGFVAGMIPVIIDQVSLLVQKLPEYFGSLAEFAQRFGLDLSTERLEEAVGTLDRSLQSIAADVAGRLFGVGSRLVTTFFQLLTIGLFTFYLTADAPRLRRAVLSAVSPERQGEVLRLMEIAIDKTGGYFYSRLLLAAVSTLVTWGVLAAIGVPFALPLGLWVGVLSQFVPVVGTYIGGILPLLIALLETPIKAVWVAAFILVYQQVENYVIAPRITARTMSLHPAIAFGSAIVGATLLGAPGALMALPVAATIQVFVASYLRRHQLVESALLELPSERPKRSKRERPEPGGADEVEE